MPPPDTFTESTSGHSLKRGHMRADLNVLRAYLRGKDKASGQKQRQSSVARRMRKQSQKQKRHPLGPMQAAILKLAQSIGLTEIALMNRLQLTGRVSDIAVYLEDVAESDCRAAMQFVPWLD